MEQYIWYERHRPKDLKQLSLPKAYRKIFKQYIADSNIPHLLLFGPPGSGKTTLAHIFMDLIPSVRLVLNASSADRGIATIKTRVKEFASSQAPKGKGKIILLDEADHLTPDAQPALRNTIEAYSKTCRFILTANYPDKIIPALHSRCTCFSFGTIPKKKLKGILIDILGKENIKINSKAEKHVNLLITKYYPDIRTVINQLQASFVTGKLQTAYVGSLKIDTDALFSFLRHGQMKSIRNTIINVNDFSWLFQRLFDDFIPKHCKGKEGMIAIIIAEYLRWDPIVANREINFVACCCDIIEAMGIKILWKK